MGGLIVFLGIAIPYLVLSGLDTASLAVFGVALGCAALGFADDWIKITKRRSLGLGARYKLLVQIGLALALWWVAYDELGLAPSLEARVFDAEIYLGPVVYLVFVYFVIAGASNAVNLTDGLDGLAAGSCATVLLAYTAITITNGQEGLAVLSACLVGASVGFLWFNSFPASIFMGDTGSLGLGGAIGALAVMTQTELLLIIHRRDLRHRGALGRRAGDQLQALSPSGPADGAGPPSLRAAGLVGDEDHAALLDHRRRLLGDRLHPVPELDPLAAAASGERRATRRARARARRSRPPTRGGARVPSSAPRSPPTGHRDTRGG